MDHARFCRGVVFRGVPGINNAITGAVPALCENAPKRHHAETEMHASGARLLSSSFFRRLVGRLFLATPTPKKILPDNSKPNECWWLVKGLTVTDRARPVPSRPCHTSPGPSPPPLPPLSTCRTHSVPGMHWKGREVPPPPSGRPAYAQPLPPRRQVPPSMACVTDSNRPQPLRQPPPTACATAPGAASEAPSLLMHPCSAPPFRAARP